MHGNRSWNRERTLLACAVLVLMGVHGLSRAAAPVRPLRVFAPWCMEKRLRRIVEVFQEKRPTTPVRFTTGTPGQLIKRVRAGEKPDVYIAMGPAEIEVLQWMAPGPMGEGVEVLRQTLLLAVSADAGDTVLSLRDLAKREVRSVGMGRPTLTSGRLAQTALRKLGILDVVGPKAKTSPLRQLVLGKVQAAVLYEQCCYEEDLHVGELALRRGIAVATALPKELCEPFPVMAVAFGNERARPDATVFLDTLRGKRAQDILRRHGEGSCPVCEMEP